MLANIPYSVYKQDKVCINSRLAAAASVAATGAQPDDVVTVDADTECSVDTVNVVVDIVATVCAVEVDLN